MAEKTLEKELKAQKIQLRTDMGTLKTTAYEVLQDMKPTEYTGKITVPEEWTGIIGIAIQDQLAQRFSEGRLEVVHKQRGVYTVESQLYLVSTVEPTLVGKATIFASDSLEEVAKYLRKVWCIPFKGEPIPDSIDKLNKWLHDYGASDIKVAEYKGLIAYSYRIDGHYPSAVSNSDKKEITGFTVTPDGCKKFAEWISKKRPQLVKCWLNAESDIQREKEEANSIASRKLQLTGNTEVVCRVITKCADGSFILQDMNYQTKQFGKEKIKQLFKQGAVNVIDLQVSSDNRLVKKHIDLKKLCREHGPSSPLTVPEQRAILFCGLAYINTCMKPETKQKLCNEIKATGSIDAEDLISMFTYNEQWSWEHFCRLDTACRDKVIDLIYDLAKNQ